MAPPFTRLSKAVRNPLMPPARATSGGPSIPHVHSLLHGRVFPPTCPELASLVAPRCCDCLFQDLMNKPPRIRSPLFTGRPVLVHSPSDSQLLFRASGLHSVTFGGLVYASRPSPECCRQERSPVLGGSEIMLFVSYFPKEHARLRAALSRVQTRYI